MRFAPIALIIAAAALSPGCRADDGPSFKYSSGTVVNRTHEDVVNTGHAITTLPAVVAASFTDGWKNCVKTTHLYYDATSTTK